MKNQTINFYAGIISVILYIYVFYNTKLYAESLLNIYYLIVSVAGIFLWQKNKKKQQLPITKTTKQEWLKATLLFGILFSFLFFILKKYSDSNVPFADSLVSAVAWVGTFLMIYRKLENWILLNISNLLAIPLFIYKGLELTAILMVIYFIIAVLGYFRWRKDLALNET